jgi:hypothetical protein
MSARRVPSLTPLAPRVRCSESKVRDGGFVIFEA